MIDGFAGMLPAAAAQTFVDVPNLRGFEKSPHGIYLATDLQAWESGGNGQMDPSVTRDGDTMHLLYCAHNGAKVQIGLASCAVADYPNGLVRYAGNPILPANQQAGVDNNIVAGSTMMRMADGSGIMFYHANAGAGDQGCVATCSAVNYPFGPWTPYAGNPVVPKGAAGTWNAGYVHIYTIIPPRSVDPVDGSLDGYWHILAGGGDVTGDIWKGGHYISSDAFTWHADPRNPVCLPTGVGGDFDSYGVHPLGRPRVVNGLYYVLYQGYDHANWVTGMWCSRDLHSFARDPHGQLLQLGAVGESDHGSIEGADIYWDRAVGRADHWYCGSDAFQGGQGGGGGSNYRLMLATSTI
jgi:hypothetical protein